MALTPFFSRSSLFDPFPWDPLIPTLGLWDSDSASPSRQALREASAVANTQVDWKETPEAHIFDANLPGLTKEEVKVQIEDGRVLAISGERAKEKEEKNEKWHCVERSRSSFLRRFRLPENAKVEELTAQVQNGVLTITVPKKQPPKPNIRTIEIS